MNQIVKPGRIFILDTDTGSGFTIPEIDDVLSLAWSPDGTQLASLQRPRYRMYTKSTMRILVYELRLGETTSNLKIVEYQWGKTEINIPHRRLVRKFLPYHGRIGTMCSTPLRVIKGD